MFSLFLRMLKYINIAIVLIVIFNFFDFSIAYFDSKYEDELSKLKATEQRNNLEITTLKELIEARAKINQKIIDESFVKDEVIALKIKEVLKEILDKEIGLFKIVNLNHSVDENYINVYKTNIDISYTKNKLFTFYDLQGEILKEIDKKIKLNNSDEFELKIGNFKYDDIKSVFSITILTKKTVTEESNQ